MVEISLALVLLLSGCVATPLAVFGAGPFSNHLVNVALVGSLIGLRYPQPVYTIVIETR
jgi:starvation-inducible outer membrane lipoprotein